MRTRARSSGQVWHNVTELRCPWCTRSTSRRRSVTSTPSIPPPPAVEHIAFLDIPLARRAPTPPDIATSSSYVECCITVLCACPRHQLRPRSAGRPPDASCWRHTSCASGNVTCRVHLLLPAIVHSPDCPAAVRPLCGGRPPAVLCLSCAMCAPPRCDDRTPMLDARALYGHCTVKIMFVGDLSCHRQPSSSPRAALRVRRDGRERSSLHRGCIRARGLNRARARQGDKWTHNSATCRRLLLLVSSAFSALLRLPDFKIHLLASP